MNTSSGSDNRMIPISIAKLIVGFFQETISKEQCEELDEWINAGENNLKMFGECILMANEENRNKF